jgi:hypothetical protein
MKKILCALFISGLAASASSAQTLCAADENALYSCKIGKRLASVCASKDLSDHSGYLQYRFGASPQKLELVYPSDKRHPKTAFKLATDNSTKSSAEMLFF